MKRFYFTIYQQEGDNGRTIWIMANTAQEAEIMVREMYEPLVELELVKFE